MKKKLLSTVMCAVMAATLLTGCSSSSISGMDTEESLSGTFKIGAIGPFTGEAAAYGNAVRWGAQIAVDEINAAGGINGYQVEYKAEDDELDNNKSVDAYNKLKDWGASFIVGSTTSGCCTAVAEKSHDDNIFQITPSASAVDCIAYDNVFSACSLDTTQGTALAQYIGEHGLAGKVAVIYDSSDIYSSGVTKAFVTEAANQGLEIVSQEAFTSDSKTDFSVQIQKAIDGQAELIFLPIYYSEAAIILWQAAIMGNTATFLGCDSMDGILGAENFDTSLAEGIMLLTPFLADATDDKTQNFVNTFKEAYDIVPSQFAADAYDAVYAIKAAAEKAGLTPDMSTSDICESMKSAMTEISVDGLTSLGMTWSASGETTKESKVVIIENGTYVTAQ